MIYVTLSDNYSGVYHSQVLDVCRYFNQQLRIPIRLIAIVPMRTYKKNRKKITDVLPNAVVLPMWPGRFNWRRNAVLFLLLGKILRNQVVISRGVLATNLIIKFKKKFNIRKIIFDARGAYTAEWSEYLHNENRKLSEEMEMLERNALLGSDFHFSVSQALLEYWHSFFSFQSEKHVVIPTTLSEFFLEPLLSQEKRLALRSKYGFDADNIVLTYSGSSAGWQSFSLLESEVRKFLIKNERIRFLLLTRDPGGFIHLKKEFPNRVVIKNCTHEEVFQMLNIADYGLLIREDSMTNKVAAPTKFAEYLATGCNVLLKGQIGDYNSFIKENSCGLLLDHATQPHLHVLSGKDRERNNNLAHEYFSKYSKIIEDRYRYFVSEVID